MLLHLFLISVAVDNECAFDALFLTALTAPENDNDDVSAVFFNYGYKYHRHRYSCEATLATHRFEFLLTRREFFVEQRLPSFANVLCNRLVYN